MNWKRLVKQELKRAFWSKSMLLSLLLGSVIVITHFIQYVQTRDMNSSIYCPESVFYNWIGASSYPMQSYLYYLVLPILSVLPFGESFYEDMKSGYVLQIFTRTKKRNYFVAKYLAVFLTGGVAFTIPLLLSFILTAMRFPILMPEPVIGIGPSLTCVIGELYYSNPFLHTALFLVLDFIFAGGVATLALVVAYYAEYRFIVFLTPFILYYFVYSVDGLLGTNDYAPNYFLIPGFYQNTWWEFLVSFIVFFVVGIWFFIKAKKLEM